MRLFVAVVPATVLMFISVPAFAAFGGCVISPENPTLILGALGAGAALLPWLKATLHGRLQALGE